MAYPITYTPEPKRPAGGPRQGTKLLYSFILMHFSVTGLGIYNPRDVKGNAWPDWKATGSQHASGRAGDNGVPVVRPGGHSEGHALAHWLIVNHAALGIQEVIFAGQRWTNQTQTWKRYTGRSDHFDHVHWAQNAEAAGALTREQIESIWADAPTDDQEIDMGAREDILHAIEGLQERVDNTNRAVGGLVVAVQDPTSGIAARLAEVDKAIDDLDDNKPGGLTKADVKAAVKAALTEGTG